MRCNDALQKTTLHEQQRRALYRIHAGKNPTLCYYHHVTMAITLPNCHYHSCKLPPQCITTRTGSRDSPETHQCGASAEGERIPYSSTQSQRVHNAQEDKARRTSLVQLCTTTQQETLPKVNSEDHVISPGYMQLQAKHRSKALILSKAAASTCRQKPGPRWTCLCQTGCHLQYMRAHAHKASWNQEQAMSLPYSSICHTAALHISS